jgi:peptidoglycan hydrolase-like protein with peptidoglycan-binding domain
MQKSQEKALQFEVLIGKHAVETNQQMNATLPDTPDQEPYGQKERVLPSSRFPVVIPDPITVHLGVPNANADNMQLSFIDYISNVASSEIFPTWPEEAIRANVYAIISFTLNRVNTLWYRSRGYNFDITSTTQHDHYFVRGRTLYDPITNVVSEIFNQYVLRPGHIHPFFTSYCNGTTSKCGGLSQWGTVDLAKQGRSPLEILRTYYPNDIEIAETKVITGNVGETYFESMQSGTRSRNVEKIQFFLNRIRKAYPSIVEIKDTVGVFGSTTQQAVRKFQEIFNLKSDGIVGRATWFKIVRIYSAVTKLASLESEGKVLGIGTVPPNSDLQAGSRGFDVVILQYMLDLISEVHPSIHVHDVQEGVFSDPTKDAVIAFQRTQGLREDGIVKSATWKALYDAFWGIEDQVYMRKIVVQ